MISHSRTSTMVLGVTPVIFSKPGVVAHADVKSAAQTINNTRYMAAPRNKGTHLPSIKHNRCIASATDEEFRTLKVVGVPVAPVQHKKARDVIRLAYRRRVGECVRLKMSLQHKVFGEPHPLHIRVCATFRVRWLYRGAMRNAPLNRMTSPLR